MSEQASSRASLSERLDQLRDEVAASVTEEFLARHPDWVQRYGVRARRHGMEDARFHIDFLRGAIEIGSREAFARYAAWTSRVLAARGIDPEFLIENFDQIDTALRSLLAASDYDAVAPIIAAGKVGARLRREESVDLRRTLSCDVYLQAILGGDRRAAGNVIEEAIRNSIDPVRIYTEIFEVALHEVGRLWENAVINVATEHMATALTQALMVNLYSQLPRAEQMRGNAVIAGVEGELHQVGGHMVADLLDVHGWDVRFLGSNCPEESLILAAQQHRAELVGLSVTMLSNVASARRVLRALRERLAGARLIVGGSAFRTAPMLWKEVGADGFAEDLRAVQNLLC